MKKFSKKLSKSEKIKLYSVGIIALIILTIYSVIAVVFNNSTTLKSASSGFFNGNVINSELKNYLNFETNTTKQESNDLTMLVVGDIQAGDFMATLVASGWEPFEYVKEEFHKYDFVVASSEGVIADDNVGSPADKPYVYKAPPRMATLYKEAGIDLVTLATNHGMDLGPDALINEMDILDREGVMHVGAGTNIDEAFYPKMVIKNGVKIGFVAINDIENHITDATENSPGLAYHYSWRTQLAIQKANELCDIVIILPHWGFEHILTQDEYQMRWARQFIDWGADMVIGNHVHVRQGSEVYNGKYIFYALGNYAFSGMAWDPESIIGSMVHIKIVDKQIVDVKLSTVNLLPYEGFPQLAGDQPQEF